MTASLASVDRRLERADQHLKGLHAEFSSAFVEGKTYDVSYECDMQTREHCWWLNVYEPPDPIRWGVLVGDVVHQMRAALDNLAYQLSLLTTKGAHVRGTAFPILTEPARWDEVYRPPHTNAGRFTHRSGEHKLRQAPDAAKARIKALQPYQGMAGMNGFAESRQTDDRIRRSLLILEEFWNMDKHRVPATVATAGFVSPPNTSGVALTGGIVAGTRISFAYKAPFVDRTRLAWFTPIVTNDKMKVDAEFRPFVLFEEGGPGDDQSVRGTLQTCLADVRAVVEGFRPLF